MRLEPLSGPSPESARRLLAVWTCLSLAGCINADGEDGAGAPQALLSTASAGVGLAADYYTVPPLTSVSGVDFVATLTPASSETVALVQADVGGGPLWAGGPTNLFAARYSGSFYAPSSGLYTFYLNSDDGSALFIDGQQVILNDGVRPAMELETTVSLASGHHDLELRYFERYGQAVVELDWAGPHVAGRNTAYFGPTAETGLRAEYFSGVAQTTLAQIDFSATPARVETVYEIDRSAGFNTGFWVGGPADNFAVRYQGVFAVDVPGPHSFHVFSDDGAALYVDGQLVVDNDGVHAPRERSGSVDLSAGNHAFELRYFEHGGRADLRVDWTPPGAPRERMRFGARDGLLARYFSLPGAITALSQVGFSGTPSATERVETIDRDAGTGAFWVGGPTDRFAAQYIGRFYVPRAGTHRFFISNDDGAALFVDGQQLLINDGVHPTTTVDGALELFEGMHEIEVRYFENGGQAEMRVEWQGPSTEGREVMRFRAPPRRGLVAEFFAVPDAVQLDDIDFTAPPAATERTEYIDFNAAGGAMWPGGPNDRFAARFSGTVEVQSGGDYTFYVRSDDGAALYLDGQLIVDHDGLHGASDRSHTLQVQAGLHELELRYFERTGLASVRLDWDGPGTTGRERVYFGPQKKSINFRADYYVTAGGISDLDQIAFDGQPNAIGFLDFLDLDDSGGSFWSGGPANNFAARFSAQLEIRTGGTYAFHLTGDDGCELWIDGARVIDNDGVHGAREVSANRSLSSGSHTIEVRYFEAGGGAVLSLEWSGPDNPARSLLYLGEDSASNRPLPGDVVSTFSLPEDSPSVPLAIPLIDADGDALTLQSVSAPDAGSVRQTGNLLLFTPAPGFEGRDALRYTANDAGGEVTQGYVQLDVLASHRQPVHTVIPAVAEELSPSGRFLLVRPVATVPNSVTGARPRMNAVVAHDGALYVTVEGNAAGESQIYRLTPTTNGNYSVSLWFDVGAAVAAATGRQLNNANVAHGGARSLAFHPNFPVNGRIYISAMEDRPSNPGNHTYLSDASNPIGADSVLMEWTVVNGQVDPNSYREVFRIGMPVFDHPIKQIGFNPYAGPGDADYGLLYVAHGDGSVQSATAGGGQNNDGLGKMIRVDPLQSGNQPFTVPASNPFVGDASMLDAVYATGFRNPHHFSFNPTPGGGAALINTGVGRNNFDEVNIVEAGANYGWSEREGPMVHRTSGGGVAVGVEVLPPNEASLGFTYPATFFAHNGPIGGSFGGQALAGAYVIDNGSELDGQFVFGNFARPGRLFHVGLVDLLSADTQVASGEAVSTALSWATPSELIVLVDEDQDATTTPVVYRTFAAAIGQGRSDFRFGRGLNGELIIVNKRDGTVYAAVNTLPPGHPHFQSTAAYR